MVTIIFLMLITMNPVTGIVELEGYEQENATQCGNVAQKIRDDYDANMQKASEPPKRILLEVVCAEWRF